MRSSLVSISGDQCSASFVVLPFIRGIATPSVGLINRIRQKPNESLRGAQISTICMADTRGQIRARGSGPSGLQNGPEEPPYIGVAAQLSLWHEFAKRSPKANSKSEIPNSKLIRPTEYDPWASERGAIAVHFRFGSTSVSLDAGKLRSGRPSIRPSGRPLASAC
jgi:hypothetical protein